MPARAIGATLVSTMQLGMIGLGRMGAQMVRRLLEGGPECVVHDRVPDAVSALADDGAAGAASLEDFGDALRIRWAR